MFWLAGGLHLDAKGFSSETAEIHANKSVWMEAPPLPISWHHGWGLDVTWFPPELPTTVGLLEATMSKFTRGNICLAAPTSQLRNETFI
jgi:hypothetical protein